MKAYCPLIKNELCKYGGNKRYNLGIVSGMSSYCRLVKKWVHDIENCPQVKQEKYRVDCCNKECAWTGYSTDCVTFKHEPTYMMCPECYEVVEPVE
jgi:hypothetical protein